MGTYDEKWKEWRAPLPPGDEDPRVAHFASPGLVAASPLAGGEECALLNLTPFGPLQFMLPKVALLIHFDVVRRARETFSPHLDTVLIDTAGRLQNTVGLMDELGKVKRVAEKHGPVAETLLVLDATTGQNGLEQARVFTEAVDVTGVVLTKLDGTAKGGIVIAVQRRLGIPVKLIGLGEGPDDLAPFEPAAFVDALLAD